MLASHLTARGAKADAAALQVSLPLSPTPPHPTPPRLTPAHPTQVFTQALAAAKHIVGSAGNAHSLFKPQLPGDQAVA